MNVRLDLLLEAARVIQGHAFVVIAALILSLVQLSSAKGSRAHRVLGMVSRSL